jgi:hypothetical protein
MADPNDYGSFFAPADTTTADMFDTDQQCDLDVSIGYNDQTGLEFNVGTDEDCHADNSISDVDVTLDIQTTQDNIIDDNF